MASKRLPHYFIPEVNLFENIPSDFLQTAAASLVKVRRHPAREDESEIGCLSEDSILLGLGIGEPPHPWYKHRQSFDGDLDGYTTDKFNMEMAYLKARYDYADSDIKKLRQLFLDEGRGFLKPWCKRDLIPKASILPNKVN